MLLDRAIIFVLYALQGAVQGLLFGTVPMLMRKNPTATDVHTSQLTAIEYPFSLKFLAAPLVDGIYSKWLGRRESWLLPLQLASSAILLLLAGSVQAVLDAEPFDVRYLLGMLLLLSVATAVGDIATDSWAVSKMDDSAASVCQAAGLEFGFQMGFTAFFALKKRGLVDLSGLLSGMGAAGLAVLLSFLVRRRVARDEEEEAAEEESVEGVRDVVALVWRLVRTVPNLRWWVLSLLVIPVLSGHRSVLAVRYQDIGFSPEMFADYDLLLLPTSVAVMLLSGYIGKGRRLLTCFACLQVLQAALHVASLLHYRAALATPAAAEDATLKAVYFGLNLIGTHVGEVVFILRGAFNNRIASGHQAVSGSIVTFLACTSNFGGTHPSSWAPLLAASVGVEATAVFCTASGLAAVCLLWPTLRRLEDPEDSSWKAKVE